MNNLQYRKFCKCASGTYQFQSVLQWECSVVGQDYEYSDYADNLDWAAAASPWPYSEHTCPVKSVICGDGNSYDTGKDYQYPPKG